MSDCSRSERFHELDATRAFALFAVAGFHAVWSVVPFAIRSDTRLGLAMIQPPFRFPAVLIFLNWLRCTACPAT